MKYRFRIAVFFALTFLLLTGSYNTASAQIPGQLAQDFVAGEVPAAAEVAKLEKEVAAKPNDMALTRKLGKAYFFEFFGDGVVTSAPKAQKTLELALTLQKDDPETLAYLGALHIIRASRVDKKDPVKLKAGYDRGFELLRLAERTAPNHGAVIAIASASYIYLPDSYGMTPHVIELLEGTRKAMGPVFKRFSHHGQQRLLLTLGQAYARAGQNEKARAAFDEALEVDKASDEAGLIKAEMAKLKN